MMYRSDLKVLSACKKMQKIEGDYFVLFPKNEICHCTGYGHAEIERALKFEPRIAVRLEPSSFDACIESLISSGMIRKFGTSPAYQVTHKGWNQRDVLRRQNLEFLMTHALFPSFVSIATTLLLHFIRSLLP